MSADPQATQEFVVRVHRAEDDSLWAEVLELPGCFATGATLDELREALEEAITLYSTDNPEGGTLTESVIDEPPQARRPMEIGEMRVKVPA